MELLRSGNRALNIIKGILISFLFTIVILTIFSVLLVYTDLHEATIKPVIIITTGISILIGSSIGTRKSKKNGLINGSIIGGTYIFIIYLISSIANWNFKINLLSFAMIVIGIICGIFGGIIGVNTK